MILRFNLMLAVLIAACFFFVVPDKAFSQIGCCQNPGGNCVPGQSNNGMGPPQTGDQASCEASGGGTFIWFADEICVPNQDCPGFVATGCCVFEENSCTDDQTSAQCPVPPNELWVQDTQCSDVPECNVPPPNQGCCVIGENNCVDDQTSAQCPVPPNVEWAEGVECAFVPECNVPPPPPPTDVPTLGQWGMIVIAAFLGIYSFMVLRKRSKFNAG